MTDSMAHPPAASLSNALLVDRFRNADDSAFAELFRRHRDLVYRVCIQFLRHHEDAEDLTQETFRRVASSIQRWDNRRPIEPWLVAIAGNRCRTFLTRRRGELTGVDWSETSAILPIQSPTFRENEVREELQIVFAEFPGPARNAFARVHQDGWSYQQVSDELGVPVGTIKTWVHRARLALIDRLRPPREVSE